MYSENTELTQCIQQRYSNIDNRIQRARHVYSNAKQRIQRALKMQLTAHERLQHLRQPQSSVSNEYIEHSWQLLSSRDINCCHFSKQSSSNSQLPEAPFERLLWMGSWQSDIDQRSQIMAQTQLELNKQLLDVMQLQSELLNHIEQALSLTEKSQASSLSEVSHEYLNQPELSDISTVSILF